MYAVGHRSSWLFRNCLAVVDPSNYGHQPHLVEVNTDWVPTVTHLCTVFQIATVSFSAQSE